jgi:hypothetical protein
MAVSSLAKDAATKAGSSLNKQCTGSPVAALSGIRAHGLRHRSSRAPSDGDCRRFGYKSIHLLLRIVRLRPAARAAIPAKELIMLRLHPLRAALLAASLAFGAVLAPGLASARTYVEVNVAPPPLREEVIPAPRAGYVWAPGYWSWRRHNHVWVSGHWIHHRRGYHWVPERWEERHGHWRFDPGHWERGSY